MAITVRLELALAILLAATTLMSQASSEAWVDDGNETDCQPDVPPLIDSNATMVALQMHQWIWIENLTSPEWAPRTNSGGFFYEFLKPGFVRQQRLLVQLRFAYLNVSFVTNGDTLCASALTQYRNQTSGSTIRVSCSRICHSNFTSLGTRVNLPLVVFDDYRTLTRSTAYLAFDAVDPESRASYNCMGHISLEKMSNLQSLITRQRRCPEGDQCLFNYGESNPKQQGRWIFAGCKSEFQYNWCVSDVDLCTFNIDDTCPICCRGDLCNVGVAQKAYKKWLDGNGAPVSRAASLWTLVLCALSIRWLRSDL